MWILLALLSAFFLGCYDVSKKQSVRDNSVLFVLLTSIACSSVMLGALLLISRLSPDTLMSTPLYVPAVDLHTHLLIVMKAALVLSSWICVYSSLKHLPITLVSPINATRPMWTLLGAVLIFGELPNMGQWVGILLVLASFYAFSVVGRKEGIRFAHNRWIYCLLLGTFLGACSGLYDKYLMRQYDHMAVQVYYTFYQGIIMLLICIVKQLLSSRASGLCKTPFSWRWSILCISVFLVLSDFFYLLALENPDSLIAVVATLRRGGVVVPFLFGTLVLKDKNPKEKSICLLGVLIGMILLVISA